MASGRWTSGCRIRTNIMHLETLERHAIEHRQKFQWIDRTDAEEMVPWLDGASAGKFALLPDDGFIDPYLFTQFYARAARKHGALLKTGIEVTALQTLETGSPEFKPRRVSFQQDASSMQQGLGRVWLPLRQAGTCPWHQCGATTG